MKVIGYIRVSTEEQAVDGVSLAAQREKVIGYAKLYDLELVEIVEDNIHDKLRGEARAYLAGWFAEQLAHGAHSKIVKRKSRPMGRKP